MAASTHAITDTTTVFNAAPPTVTKANATTKGLDYTGILSAAVAALAQARTSVALALASCDATTDAANNTLLTNIASVLS